MENVIIKIKRKMHNSDNKVRLYEISKLGNVDVLLVGLIPYPGFWQFGIFANEYGYGEIGWEDRLKNLLEKAEEQTEWELRGCSTTCELDTLLEEIKKCYSLSDEEEKAIEDFIETNKNNENAKF